MDRVPCPRGLSLAFVTALALASCTPIPPGTSVTQGQLSDRWEVRFDPELGTPMQMTNRALEEGAGGTRGPAVRDSLAAAATRAVFEENARWFRFRPGIDDVRIVRSVTSGWLRELKVEQTYHGLPVAGAGYKVRVLPSGRVGTLEGRFHPDLELEVRPVLQAAQAEDRARAAYPPGTRPRFRILALEDFTRLEEPSYLMVLPLDRAYRLAWGVRIRTDDGFTRVYVDARTGEVLGAQYLGNYER